MRILVADDEVKVGQMIAEGLKTDGYHVELVHDGDAAIREAVSQPFDALVLDVNMPGTDGYGVVQNLRQRQIRVPVIFLTARGDVEDRIRGLDAGADDYIPKPFSMSELSARLRALLRRRHSGPAQPLVVGDLELDIVSRRARRAGKEIELTNREFALLEFLMISSPRAVSKNAIVERVWDQNFDPQTNVVNVYIAYLRRKIDLPNLQPLLHTVRGVGFALSAEEPR